MRPAVTLAAGAALAVLVLLSRTHDPIRQFDPGAARHLEPGAERLVLVLASGRQILVDDVEWRDSSVFFERLDREHEVPDSHVLTTATTLRRVRFWLGTDRLGRDCLSRLLHGGLITLTVGLSCALLSGLLGLALGMAAGLSPPLIDAAIMRLTDAFLAFPKISILLLGAATLSPGFPGLIVLLALTGWMAPTRLVRAQVRTQTRRDYFAAAVAAGLPLPRLAVSHLLPHVAPTLAVAISLQAADVMLLESALSFLGFGTTPAAPSWGRMIANGAPHLASAWWVSVPPGLFLSATVIALIGTSDRLRDRLDRRA